MPAIYTRLSLIAHKGQQLFGMIGTLGSLVLGSVVLEVLRLP
jgi:hypothetical protein